MELKSIFITGASAGIGRELSLLYAAPGVTLGLASLNTENQLEAVASECRAKGATVYVYAVDVSDFKEMRKCGFDYLSRVSAVDLVIANAGVRFEEDADFADPDLPRRVMDVNFIGVINTFSPFIPSMREKRAGQLAAISSIAAFRGTQNSGVYSASKAAVNIWMESLRLRMMPYNVTVSVLCAGFVATAMTKGLSFWMPGVLTPAKAAEIIASGIKRKKRVMLFPFVERLIWGGLAALPGRAYDLIITWLKANPINAPKKDMEYNP